jgi:predicted lactoylglutathione lyase
MTERQMKLGMVITMHSDLEKSVEFYKSLGLKLNFHMKDKWAEFSLGEIKFGLCPTEQKYDNIRTGVVLEVEEDLMKLYEELKASGVTFVNEPQVAPHGVMVGFKDPCGNVLDLYQATPEKMKEFAKEAMEKEAAEKAAKKTEA